MVCMLIHSQEVVERFESRLVHANGDMEDSLVPFVLVYSSGFGSPQRR